MKTLKINHPLNKTASRSQPNAPKAQGSFQEAKQLIDKLNIQQAEALEIIHQTTRKV